MDGDDDYDDENMAAQMDNDTAMRDHIAANLQIPNRMVR